jgi:alpha-amylase/alpha-mannosidase (GH57 family)
MAQMTRVHLVFLWHMHQPEYRDPSTGAFVLPWTRLHSLKDYWGMVKLLEKFPKIHATFNLVPSLVRQIEQYAVGQFHEPWFDLAFRPAADLSDEQRTAFLNRAFHANHEQMIGRWPRYRELHEKAGRLGSTAAHRFSTRELRDLQVLSQLVWTDEEYLAHDPVVRGLVEKGAGFSEEDKLALRTVQAELLSQVLPEYSRASERGQIEISVSPFYHPILPLLVHTDVAREANPQARLLHPPFRHPEDAREQMTRARGMMESLFGREPAGLWPSEGSVSEAVARMAAEAGFRWLASDEGVLGRTLETGFPRDARGVPDNAVQLYSPYRLLRDEGEIAVLFRDHFLSDLIGFVYGRMEPEAAAEDLYRRLRAIGETVSSARALTVPVILDGENAWEFYRRNGRPFLAGLYRRIEADPDIRALTVSEAIAAAGELPPINRLAAGSWINANFDIWCGGPEDLRAWDLLREAHDVYDAELARSPVPRPRFEHAYESLLAAEGSDWCWWYGPEHTSADDPDFDMLFRTHIAQVYAALGREAPDRLAQPIAGKPRHGVLIPPTGFISARVDGRVSNYFEWMGAGLYAADHRGASMHGTVDYLSELYYGFDAEHLYLRIDPVPEAIGPLRDCEFRIFVEGAGELRIAARLEALRLKEVSAEHDDLPLAPGVVDAAFDRILEVSIARGAVPIAGPRLFVSVALWHGALPIDVLPIQGKVEISLDEEAFTWSLPSPPPV